MTAHFAHLNGIGHSVERSNGFFIGAAPFIRISLRISSTWDVRESLCHEGKINKDILVSWHKIRRSWRQFFHKLGKMIGSTDTVQATQPCEDFLIFHRFLSGKPIARKIPFHDPVSLEIGFVWSYSPKTFATPLFTT